MVYVCLHSGRSLMHSSEFSRLHTYTHTHRHIHAGTHTHTHTHTHTQAHTSTRLHDHIFDTFTCRCAHCKRTMFTASLCIFCFIFCMSYYKTNLVQWLLLKKNKTKKTTTLNTAIVKCWQYIFVVFDVCICLFLFSIGSTFKQLQFAKGAKHTHTHAHAHPPTHTHTHRHTHTRISVSNSSFRFLPYKAPWFYKRERSYRIRFTITAGPNVETLWTPKAQT